MRKRILKIYGISLAVGLIYYIWIVVTGTSLPCFYYKTTGFLCPGCGTSRMFLSLAKFDISGAFAANQVVFVLLICWNAIALLCFIGKPRLMRNKNFIYSCLALSVTLLLIFCAVRNIP